MICFSLILLSLFVAVVLGQRSQKAESREPPFVSSNIPYVGHALGLLQHGVSYFVILRSKIRHPIYTINLISQKSYVINDPKLIDLVQREGRKISNNRPFVETVFRRMLGCSDETNSLILSNMDGYQHVPSYRKDMRAVEHEALTFGQSMTQIYSKSMSEVAKYIRGTATLQGPKPVDLMVWLREIYTLSTATALYGPHHPFVVSKDLIQAFWDFDSGLKMLVLGLFPAITAPRALKGRERLVQELRNFLKSNHKERDGFADIVRSRQDVNDSYSCSDDCKARSELGLISGLLINTVPVTFWMLVHILSSQSLHSAILTEIHALIQKVEGADSPVQCIDLTTIKQRCPILISTYYEVLRTTGSAIATLSVNEDTLLDQRYLLKKGAIVQIPCNSIHTDPQVWGPDAKDFKPERFIRSGSPTKKQHPSAFRAFGGGAGLCPGRFLAMDEVTTFTVLMLCTFDIKPGGSSVGFMLPQKCTRDLGSIMNPVGPFHVVLNCNYDRKDVVWKF